MIKEDIEKAANEFADREYEYNDIDRNALYKGFYWGAQWRINSVWHNANEVPKKKGYILVWINGDHPIFVTWNINVIPTDWAKTVKLNNVVKWAYIEDIIPNMEE
ncbi:MAG: protein of unknown function DUF551 [Satomivirus wayo]|jgi:hypothetical protein|uniref:DUF551 domain-containing protein n=1 Tax=Bacteriophage sp. TaxID=38018 RepID=A0ABY5T2J5_9VIRU|nr:MAG: protein of unknown function DUF551 [Bacteriophage sp.]